MIIKAFHDNDIAYMYIFLISRYHVKCWSNTFYSKVFSPIKIPLDVSCPKFISLCLKAKWRRGGPNRKCVKIQGTICHKCTHVPLSAWKRPQTDVKFVVITLYHQPPPPWISTSPWCNILKLRFKPVSIMANIVGSRLDSAGQVGAGLLLRPKLMTSGHRYL